MIPKMMGTIAILMLTIGSGIYQGRLLNRWGTPADLTLAAESLDRLPLNLGNFTHVSDGEPLSESVCHELGLVGHLNRTYVHDETGEQFTLLLMVGQPGRLVRHPPNICYTSRGAEQAGKIELITGLGQNEKSEFKILNIRPRGLGETPFSVTFSHAFDGDWSAPDLPRLHFGGHPHLYKVQVLSTNGYETGEPSHGLRGFLEQFIDSFEATIVNSGRG